MISYKEWKLLQESVNPGFTLGLGAKPTIGGVIGSKLQEVGFNPDEDEEDVDDEELEDDFEDEEAEEDEDDGLEGDLFGASEDEGPEKSFPPDDSEEMDGLPTPDEEMLGGDELGDDLGAEGDDLGAAIGGPPAPVEDEPDMDSLLGDIDPELAGLDGDFDPSEFGEPCPDCNADGNGDGDPECPTCAGSGFLTDPVGEEEGEGDLDFMQDLPALPGPEESGPETCNKFMSKSAPLVGTRGETGDDFLANLTNNATVQRKFKSGLAEDYLIHSEPQEPQPGQVGFAPQSRVGAIGGGYTQDDIKDIPVLGEGVKKSRPRRKR